MEVGEKFEAASAHCQMTAFRTPSCYARANHGRLSFIVVTYLVLDLKIYWEKFYLIGRMMGVLTSRSGSRLFIRFVESVRSTVQLCVYLKLCAEAFDFLFFDLQGDIILHHLGFQAWHIPEWEGTLYNQGLGGSMHTGKNATGHTGFQRR